MNRHAVRTVEMTISFALVVMMLASLPNSTAHEYKETYRDLEIVNNDHWAEVIAEWDARDEYRFSVTEVNGLVLDVYIMRDSEYRRYKNDEDFFGTYTKENTNSTGDVEWTCTDDDRYYLVVDNRDNLHDEDAHADENVTVNISWVNRTEKKDHDDYRNWVVEEIIGTAVCCSLIVVILGSIYYFMEVRPYRHSQTPYDNIPLTSPRGYSQVYPYTQSPWTNNPVYPPAYQTEQYPPQQQQERGQPFQEFPGTQPPQNPSEVQQPQLPHEEGQKPLEDEHTQQDDQISQAGRTS